MIQSKITQLAFYASRRFFFPDSICLAYQVSLATVIGAELDAMLAACDLPPWTPKQARAWWETHLRNIN